MGVLRQSEFSEKARKKIEKLWEKAPESPGEEEEVIISDELLEDVGIKKEIVQGRPLDRLRELGFCPLKAIFTSDEEIAFVEREGEVILFTSEDLPWLGNGGGEYEH